MFMRFSTHVEMDTVDALSLVCDHLKETCKDAEMLNLRRRLNRARVECCRLRKKAQKLDEMLASERVARIVLAEISRHLIRRMESGLLPHSAGIEHE